MLMAVSHYFPFKKVRSGETVIIYGMGTIGHQYVSQLIATEFCKISFAVDQIHCGEIFMGVPILEPKEIMRDRSSLIVIAVESTYSQNEILRQLQNWDIQRERIVCDVAPYAPQAVSWVLQRSVINFEDLTIGQYTLIRKLHNCLRMKQLIDKSLIRIGNNRDGGYLMAEDFVNGGVAYSFGIGTNVTWEKELSRHGYKIYMYDHTIPGVYDLPMNCQYHRMGLADSHSHGDELVELEQLIYRNGHDDMSRMVLKIDIEGAEWGFLNIVSGECLEKFDQIIMELHGLCELNALGNKIRCLEKINETHQLIHVHPNNNGQILYLGGKAYCNLMEVTYVNKNRYMFCDTRETLPHVLDFPCLPFVEEIGLGDWNNPDYYSIGDYDVL